MKTIDLLIRTRNSEYFKGFKGIDGPTPVKLCEQQISAIPFDYSDPNKTWLIPAAGHGTHAIILYWKYMEGLSKIFINSEERSRHILKNMIYLIEINPIFCDWLRQDGFINVIEGDYSKYTSKMTFNAIVGNSPFLKGKWKKFLEKSVELSSQYVCLISPDNTKTFSAGSKKFNEFLINHGIQDVVDCTEYFDVESGNIVYYLIDKNNTPKPNVLDFNVNVDKFYEIIDKKGPKINAILSNKRSGKFTRASRYDTNGDGRIENIKSIKNDGVLTEYIDVQNTHVVDLSKYWVTNRYFGKNEDAPIYEINNTMGVSSNILLIERISNLSINEFKEIYLSKTFRKVLEILRGKSFDTSPRHLKQLPILTIEEFNSL
jgi:hypothetical protein